MALVRTAPAAGQQLGHKVLGSLGLLADSQPDNGLLWSNNSGDHIFLEAR
jgi:hypothetical protein